MTETRIRRTVLLEDTPAENDAFSSIGGIGPHHRLANAIGKMMTDESGGRMIGLEGGWGSGKSTVISLLLKNLETARPDQIASVIFDAWAHEGDPLRRTFIESLVRGLQKKRWVDPEAWNNKLDRISNRRRESETKSTSRPTALAYCFAISLLFVPLGTALVGIRVYQT